MLPRIAYSVLSELAAPVFALAAYRRSGIAAARHVLALSRDRRPPRPGYLLWVHGASVGETMSALPIVRHLLASDKHASVLMTATTPTAIQRLAMEDLGPRVVLQQRPADAVSTVRRFLNQWQPSALLLIESELWPSLLHETHGAGVPIALVNARLSARSLARWRALAPGTLRDLLTCCSVVLAQTPRMASELRKVVCDEDGRDRSGVVLYRGDLKQLAHRGTPRLDSVRSSLRSALSARMPEGGTSADYCGGMWLAASTHEGEEKLLLDAHAALRRGNHPNLLLVIVPRHPERGRDVVSAAKAALASAAAHDGPHPATLADEMDRSVVSRSLKEAVSETTAVYVCDTLGELPALYSLVGVAFVGGSFVPLGGHSLLEAAQAEGGCAVIHGPYIEAVEEAASALAGATPPTAWCVSDSAELAQCLDRLLSDPALHAATRAASAATASVMEDGVLDAIWGELSGPLRLPASI